MICGSSSTEGCSGTATPIPPSLSLDSSPGIDPNYSHLIILSKKITIFNPYDHIKRKSQVQETSRCTWGQPQLRIPHPRLARGRLAQKESPKPDHLEHQRSGSSLTGSIQVSRK